MAQQNKSNSLTEGSVARGMLLFAIPIFISNLFQQLYNAADSLIVGNFLGGEALAAVGSSGSLIFLLTGFVNGVALGAGVLIARYFGAKDWESLEKAIHTTVALGLAAGAVLTVAGVILTPQILHWMGTPEDVIGNSVAYFRTYFLGSIAVVMYNVGASILQSVGNSRSHMDKNITEALEKPQYPAIESLLKTYVSEGNQANEIIKQTEYITILRNELKTNLENFKREECIKVQKILMQAYYYYDIALHETKIDDLRSDKINSFVIATMLLRKRSSKYNCKTSKTLLSQNVEKFRGIREVACVLPNDM